MSDKEELLKDLQQIRDTMKRSEQVITLDGRLGIANGIICLLGIGLGYATLPTVEERDYGTMSTSYASYHLQVMIAAAVFVTCLVLSYVSARRTHQHLNAIWSTTTLKLAYALGLPLFVFGMPALSLGLETDHFFSFIGWVPALLLLGFGLAIHSAAPYSRKNMVPITVISVVSGMLAFMFPHLSHIWLAIGFGLGNILQGVIMLMDEKA